MKNDRRKVRYYLWCRVVLLCRALVVTVLVLSTGSTLQAQIVNGNFDAPLLQGATPPLLNAFSTAAPRVPGSWFCSHGTPDISVNIGGNSTNCAYMWSDSSGAVLAATGEGLFVQCPVFVVGQRYSISLMAFSNTAPSNFIIALANGLTAGGGNPQIPNVQMQVVRNTTNMTTGSWQTINFTFIPTATFNQLWFFPRSAGGFQDVAIDNVVVAPSCLVSVVYNGVSPPVFTSASDLIAVLGTSTTAVVSGSQTATLQAGNRVQLLPTFRATPTGSGFFHALIAPCPTSLPACSDVINGPIPKQGAADNNDSAAVFSLEAFPGLSGKSLANYPNPFTGKTTIQYRVYEVAPVTLEVVNMLGERVAELVHNEGRTVGVYSVEFDASRLPRGVYYIVLRSGTATVTKKMVVIP